MKKTTVTKRFNPRRIREARTMFGMNADAFGDSIGKSGQTILNWESGATSPTIEDLDNICVRYGLDLSYFVRIRNVA